MPSGISPFQAYRNTTARPTQDGNGPTEIEFSKDLRGRFYRLGNRLNLSAYLDDQVLATLTALANGKGGELPTLADDLLRKDIEPIELGC